MKAIRFMLKSSTPIMSRLLPRPGNKLSHRSDIVLHIRDLRAKILEIAGLQAPQHIRSGRNEHSSNRAVFAKLAGPFPQKKSTSVDHVTLRSGAPIAGLGCAVRFTAR